MNLNSFEFGKILGYHISDGTLGEKSDFTNTNIDLIHDLARLMRLYYPENKVAIRLRKGGMHKDGLVRSAQYRLYCRTHKQGGFNKGSNRWYNDYKELGLQGKQTMEALMDGSREFKKGLIQGVFNGDGSLYIMNGYKDNQYPMIHYCFGIHHKMGDQFAEILKEFDLEPTVKCSYNKRIHDIRVHKMDSVQKNLEILSDIKYPAKFKQAKELLESKALISVPI